MKSFEKKALELYEKISESKIDFIKEIKVLGI